MSRVLFLGSYHGSAIRIHDCFSAMEENANLRLTISAAAGGELCPPEGGRYTETMRAPLLQSKEPARCRRAAGDREIEVAT